MPRNTDRPPVSGEPSLRERLERFAPSDDDYSVVEFTELVRDILDIEAYARATPPSLDAAHRPAFDPWVLCVCNNNHRLSEYASLASGQES